jgi:hypothetical protein
MWSYVIWVICGMCLFIHTSCTMYSCHVSCVMCHVSCVMCHVVDCIMFPVIVMCSCFVSCGRVSCVMCHVVMYVSCVMCHVNHNMCLRSCVIVHPSYCVIWRMLYRGTITFFFLLPTIQSRPCFVVMAHSAVTTEQ